MAATTWAPKPRSGRHWLLSNGKTVEAPVVEETSTGRKVRIAGNATSHYSADEELMIWTHVQKEAERLGGRIVMPLHRDGSTHLSDHGTFGRNPKPHFVGGSGWGGQTEVWWKFRHPTLPIEAVVRIEIHGIYSSLGRDSSQSISGVASFPILHPEHGLRGEQANAWSAKDAVDEVYQRTSEGNTPLVNFSTREPLTWPIDSALGDARRYEGVRSAAQEFLRRIRVVEEIDSLVIPDTRTPSKPAYMTLELVDTNVNGQLVDDLRDFLDTGPAMDRAVKAYQEMQAALKALGLVLDDKRSDDLLSALQAGGDAISVNCGNPAGESGPDLQHSLTLRMATGTFIVHCSHRAQAANPNKIAEKWDEARTIASITGEEPLLMGFARAYAEQSESIRAQQILDATA